MFLIMTITHKEKFNITYKIRYMERWATFLRFGSVARPGRLSANLEAQKIK